MEVQRKVDEEKEEEEEEEEEKEEVEEVDRTETMREENDTGWEAGCEGRGREEKEIQRMKKLAVKGGDKRQLDV
ncbi:hypothetical protein Pcinc_040109 [Petrolisthes cinctipes]|uniref:Uncharacterized protein n=1 Tax=Petrolisthes cinctipes TaxID=88211 RepID=A0AAE1BML1_PETCI|nr:hypothetical protein Pcinc_040109 [Petrolisthes cinctipes]